MSPEEVELICIAFHASGQVLCQSKVFCFCRYMGVSLLARKLHVKPAAKLGTLKGEN